MGTSNLCFFFQSLLQMMSIDLPLYHYDNSLSQSWQVFLCSFHISLALPLYFVLFISHLPCHCTFMIIYYPRRWQVFLCSFHISLALPLYFVLFISHLPCHCTFMIIYYPRRWQVFLCSFHISLALPLYFVLFISHLPCHCTLFFSSLTCLPNVPL